MVDLTDVPAARSSAHPVPGRRIPGALLGGRLAARTAPRGSRTIGEVPRTGSVEDIRAHKRSLLVTYRRDGTPVATPVWAAESGGCLYVRSERRCGKAKRLRRDLRMLVVPCTVRGKPLGPPFEAIARMVPPAEERAAELVLARRYGLGRALFEWTMDRMRIDMAYLEIEPVSWRERGLSGGADA